MQRLMKSGCWGSRNIDSIPSRSPCNCANHITQTDATRKVCFRLHFSSFVELVTVKENKLTDNLLL